MNTCKKHRHECEQCVREQIAELEKKVAALKGKLPLERIVVLPAPLGINVVPVPYPVIPQVIQPWQFGNPRIVSGTANAQQSFATGLSVTRHAW